MDLSYNQFKWKVFFFSSEIVSFEVKQSISAEIGNIFLLSVGTVLLQLDKDCYYALTV